MTGTVGSVSSHIHGYRHRSVTTVQVGSIIYRYMETMLREKL